MLEKLFHNADLDIELTSFIDNKQNVWLNGKDIARILGYSDIDQAIRKNIETEDKFKGPVQTTGGLQQSFNIQLFRERLSEKVHSTIPKGIVGGFDCTVLQRNLKEWLERSRTYVCEC